MKVSANQKICEGKVCFSNGGAATFLTFGNMLGCFDLLRFLSYPGEPLRTGLNPRRTSIAEAQRANSSNSAISKEKMPSASVTAKPK
jgi:hypothetical protein